MESQIFIIIIVLCVALILIGFIKHQFNSIITFGLRIFGGLLGVYIVNILLHNLGLGISVGTNSVTALAMGILGLPGFLMLYGVATYFYLT